MSVDSTKLPLQGLQQQVFALVFEAVNEAEGGYDARRHRAEEFTSRVLDLVHSTQQSEDAPTSYTPATEDEVKLALEEYQDCSEYNSDRVNMKAALDAVLYRRGSTVQAFDEADDDGNRCWYCRCVHENGEACKPVISDDMVQRALDSFVTGAWEPGEENDILLSHDRMREALEAALNG